VLSSDEGTIDYNDCEQEDSDANTSREDKVHPNQWVVMAYPGKNKNTTLNYIGQVTKVLRRINMVEVKFVRKEPGGLSFKFPNVDELDEIPCSYIIEVLSEPNMNNRSQLIFKGLKSTVMR